MNRRYVIADQNSYDDLCTRLVDAMQSLHSGLIVGLNGDLGVGKTYLVRSLLRRLGYESEVKSPTFTLMEQYTINGHVIWHLDCYRLHDVDDLAMIGFDDLADDAYVFIEWAEQVNGLSVLDVTIDISDSPERSMSMKAHNAKGKSFLEKIVAC